MEIKNVRKTWFETWGEEAAQNTFLKGLLLFCTVILTAETALITVFTLKKPALFAIGEKTSDALKITPPTNEVILKEIERTLKSFAAGRFTWDYQTIEDSFKKLVPYIEEDFVKKFQSATSEEIKFAREKRIAQRFFINDVNLNKDEGKAILSGDRIISVDGLRAVAPLTLEITFTLSKRTPENPEGVYIMGEKIITNGAGGGGK